VVDPGKTAMTNAEVLQWVGKTQKRYQDTNRTMPSNFKYITGAVASQLTRAEAPLNHAKDPNYTEQSYDALLEVLVGQFDMEKGEVLQIFNHRPASLIELALYVEELDSRFEEHQQQEMLDAIGRNLRSEPGQGVVEPIAVSKGDG
ncbi:hypothetical protein LTS18_007811, partial [Coniosporium uncinatum]